MSGIVDDSVLDLTPDEVGEQIAAEEAGAKEAADRPPKVVDTSATPVAVKDFVVDILSNDSDIVAADAEGDRLHFRPDIGYFKELDEDMVRGLTPDNRARYSTAKVLFESLNREASGQRPVSTPGVEIDPTVGTGRSAHRIRIDAPPAFKAQYHTYWAGNWEWRDLIATQGYTVVRGDEVNSACKTPSNTHQILRNGVMEHILLKRPKEMHEAHLKAVEHRSKGRMQAIKENAKGAMAAAGVQPFEGDVPPGRQATGVAWQPEHVPGAPRG